MKKNLFVILIFCLCGAVGFATNAGAVGLGMYFTSMAGSPEWDVDSEVDGDVDSYEWDTDESVVGFGFVLDTTVARDQLFNYRFQIGLEKSEIDIEGDAEAELTGIAMTHDFGFGVSRTKNARIWIGPELRMAFMTGSVDMDETYWTDVDWDITMFNLGIGPVLGANFNIGPAATLSIKVGFLWETMVGSGEVDMHYYNYSVEADDDYEASGTMAFINFAILYRIADNF